MEGRSHAETQDPATALRVIGQELADLFPLSLEIEFKDDQFVVTGRGLPEPAQAEGAEENILRKVWKALIRHDPGSDLVDWQLKSVPFARIYSQAELSRSDNGHFKRRMGGNDLPEIYSLGERLRIIGRLVRAKDGHLIHLTKTLNNVTFRYRDADGVVHSEDYSAEELYRVQRQYYAQRGTGNESLNDMS
jgi:hypothetical protein